MKIQDLYINPKNICTIGLYANHGEYGLVINGTNITFGTYNELFGESEKSIKKIKKDLKKYQQMIIKEVEKCQE